MSERRRHNEMKRIEADRGRRRSQHIAQAGKEFSDATAQITRPVNDEPRDDEQTDEREGRDRVAIATGADPPMLLPGGLDECRAQTVKVERREQDPEAQRAER